MKSFKFVVSLRFRSQNADLSEFCKKLELTPNRIWLVGEPRTSPTGELLNGVNSDSYCTIRLDLENNETLPCMLFRNALGLMKYKEEFQKLRNGGGQIEYFIGWFSSENSGDTFDFKLLGLLGELGIDLAMDVYGDKRVNPEPDI